jgi:hypothetical protein
MKLLLYKVDTNFFENTINKGFQSGKPIEWE